MKKALNRLSSSFFMLSVLYFISPPHLQGPDKIQFWIGAISVVVWLLTSMDW